jgi:hypothetical protein
MYFSLLCAAILNHRWPKCVYSRVTMNRNGMYDKEPQNEMVCNYVTGFPVISSSITTVVDGEELE